MVLGSILNWVVGRSLDLTVNTICWITQKTAYGIYYVGYYLIKKKQNQINDINNKIDNDIYNENDFQIIFLTKNELNILYSQNELLKKEIDLLKKIENIDIDKLLLLKNNNQILDNQILDNQILDKNKKDN
jgi:hypothetical protein